MTYHIWSTPTTICFYWVPLNSSLNLPTLLQRLPLRLSHHILPTPAALHRAKHWYHTGMEWFPVLGGSSKTPGSAWNLLAVPGRMHIWSSVNHVFALASDLALLCLSAVLEVKLLPAFLCFSHNSLPSHFPSWPQLNNFHESFSSVYRGWGSACHYSAAIQAHLFITHSSSPRGRILYVVLHKSETMQKEN